MGREQPSTASWDADDMESGTFGIYKDKNSRKGSWPLKMINLNATPEAAAKLWEESEKLVGA